jgi:type VI secretion system protein ImpA
VETLGRFAGRSCEADAQALRVARAEPAAGGESDRPAPGIAERDQESPIRGRAQALAQLRRVAAYFRRTEPHSPVAYLAEKAASWGEMPLHQWLRAVLRDNGALLHVEELLGVAPPAPGDGGDGR